MKTIYAILLLVLINELYAQSRCHDTGQCISLSPRSTQNFSGKGIGGSTLRVTNITSYNLLAPFPNPDWSRFLSSGHVNSCSILSRYWSGWSGWSACSRSCGGGTQSRSRTCILPGGACGDAPACSGSSTESQSCNTHACCSDTTASYTINSYQYGACSPCGPWGLSCGWTANRSGGDCNSSTHYNAGESCTMSVVSTGSCGTNAGNASPGVHFHSCTISCKCK